MRVFVTGASGWIGSALVPELIVAGHEVTGLARSDASAVALTKAGAQVRRGDLGDPDSLREAAGASDGVIHLAFNVGMVRSGNFQGAVDADRRAVEAPGEARTGSERPLVIASATIVLLRALRRRMKGDVSCNHRFCNRLQPAISPRRPTATALSHRCRRP